jgi:hypothetical protein
MPEKLAIFAPAQTMYVYAANFVEHKEGREKESEEGQAPGSDLTGAREVDPAEFNAERKGAKKSAAK